MSRIVLIRECLRRILWTIESFLSLQCLRAELEAAARTLFVCIATEDEEGLFIEIHCERLQDCISRESVLCPSAISGYARRIILVQSKSFESITAYTTASITGENECRYLIGATCVIRSCSVQARLAWLCDPFS